MSGIARQLGGSVVRGEVDNREKGRVTGRLWFYGNPEPVDLDLEGNGRSDVAGCRLCFRNPTPAPGQGAPLDPRQSGTLGDFTASRKVRLSLSHDEAAAGGRRGGSGPASRRWGNVFCLEWFSAQDGPVTIEGAFEIEISVPTWTLTPADREEQVSRRHEALAAWTAPNAAEEWEEDEAEGEEDAPMDEFAWERFFRECDARTERYMALWEKYENAPDRDLRIAREMGWDWLVEAIEAGVDEDADEAADLAAFNAEEEDAADELEEPLTPNPVTEGVDWIRTERGRVCHPLYERAFDLTTTFWRHCELKGLVGQREEGADDARVADLAFQAQMLTGRLAGALNGLAYDAVPDGGFVVAYLKRALKYLNAALGRLSEVRSCGVLDEAFLARFEQDLFEIRAEMLLLMERYRQRG